MQRSSRTALWLGVVLVLGLGVLPLAAEVGPFQGGPTNYFTASDGTEIAFSVMLPRNFDASKRYPAILEMAGYENGSASDEGFTMTGQSKDFLCSLDPDPESGRCPEAEPPLAEDSHRGTSAIRYRDAYVVVHASLPGSGCSGGQWDLYSVEQAKAGAELIDNWIAKQSWSNGRVGLLGHSYSGSTALLIASHRPKHLLAMSISGMIDDNYRGITYPGGVFNTLFPPLWYLGIRPAYDKVGGTGQGTLRNLDNENGRKCVENAATQRRGTDNDPLVNGGTDGLDNEYWQRTGMIASIGKIAVPFHIAGAYQDEQTGARGTTRLWEHVRPGVPKRLLQFNGDHGTNVESPETWGDRKAWLDHWLRGITPDAKWGMTAKNAAGKTVVKRASVRTLFEVHPNEDGDLVSNGQHDANGYPLDGTRFTDYYLCAGKTLRTDRGSCEKGSDPYLSGTRRQSWLYQAGSEAGPPFTSADGPDQIRLAGPEVKPGQTWAMAGPMRAHLYLAATATDTDLFVQVADEEIATGTTSFLQRGWLKASHRAIDTQQSDYTNVDPTRRGYLYRPHRPHVDPEPIEPNVPLEYLIEIWPVAHVFRPGHRLVMVVTAPPAIDSNYSYATQRTQPVSVNTLIYNDKAHPSRLSLPVLPLASIQNLGITGPECGDYWQVRCAR